MRIQFFVSAIFFLAFVPSLRSQPIPLSENSFIDQLNLNAGFPPKLLGTKSVLFHSHDLTEKELSLIQDYFVRTGVDAVCYFPIDMLTAGRDVTRAFADFLTKREISNLVFAEKAPEGFRISVTVFNNKESIFDAQQPAWSVSNRSLTEAMKIMMRSALAELKKENLLINDFPERDLTINPILGKRNEFFAVDMKVDLVAVPKFGDAQRDKELEEIFAANFPFQYKLVEPGISEKELRKQGMLYILCFIHTRGEVAKDLLGYKVNESETAFASVTFPDGKLQLKTIPSGTPVYKVYFKHIDSGNVFLGNKWDADLTWQQALLNNIRAMKAELRLN